MKQHMSRAHRSPYRFVQLLPTRLSLNLTLIPLTKKPHEPISIHIRTILSTLGQNPHSFVFELPPPPPPPPKNKKKNLIQIGCYPCLYPISNRWTLGTHPTLAPTIFNVKKEPTFLIKSTIHDPSTRTSYSTSFSLFTAVLPLHSRYFCTYQGRFILHFLSIEVFLL